LTSYSTEHQGANICSIEIQRKSHGTAEPADRERQVEVARMGHGAYELDRTPPGGVHPPWIRNTGGDCYGPVCGHPVNVRHWTATPVNINT
jgi:hypothetical protein